MCYSNKECVEAWFRVENRKLDEEMAKEFDRRCKESYDKKNREANARIDSLIKNVKFNGPATIIFWADGTKTAVTCQEGDTYDREKGLLAAIVKHSYGKRFNRLLEKWCPIEEEEEPENEDSKSKADIFVENMKHIGEVLRGEKNI